MSCIVEVYDITQHREGRSTTVHTNLGYTTFTTWKGAFGVVSTVGWQYRLATEKERRTKFDSWLRDGPPECTV